MFKVNSCSKMLPEFCSFINANVYKIEKKNVLLILSADIVLNVQPNFRMINKFMQNKTKNARKDFN